MGVFSLGNIVIICNMQCSVNAGINLHHVVRLLMELVGAAQVYKTKIILQLVFYMCCTCNWICCFMC